MQPSRPPAPDLVRRAVRQVRRRVRPARAERHPERLTQRLVPDPVFVLCATRSGSTLLRVLLDAHPRICAPHEMHLKTLQVSTDRDYARLALEQLGLTEAGLADMLWDRVLFGLQLASGKPVIVDKTPQNVADWRRISAYWPQARYIHLRRHPGAILQSRQRARPDAPLQSHLALINGYGSQLDEARAALPGPTVRYEDLTERPEEVLRELCTYLGVPWRRRMMHYGQRRRSEHRSGLGDWSAAIKSGRIQPARELPTLDEVPEGLHALVQRWGYA